MPGQLCKPSHVAIMDNINITLCMLYIVLLRPAKFIQPKMNKKPDTNIYSVTSLEGEGISIQHFWDGYPSSNLKCIHLATV
jgi:hypothetical protein